MTSKKRIARRKARADAMAREFIGWMSTALHRQSEAMKKAAETLLAVDPGATTLRQLVDIALGAGARIHVNVEKLKKRRVSHGR